MALSNVGTYEISEFYPRDTQVNGALLSDLTWGADSITVDELGLFRWELEVTQDTGSAMEIRRYEDYAFGFFQSRGLVELSSDTVQRALSCQACNAFGTEGYLISADLTNQGILRLASRNLDMSTDAERFTINPPLGFFDQFKSTASLLGVPSVDQAGVMGSPRRITFSFWSDARLRDLPIVFEAASWGFEYVDLISMVGGHALLKLTTPTSDQAGADWGLYDVYTDRLQAIEPEALITTYFDQIDVTQYKAPTLTGDKMIWLQAQQPDADPEVLILQLTR